MGQIIAITVPWRNNIKRSLLNSLEVLAEIARYGVVEHVRTVFKDGAYYCYCAYVLRISRYWDFLSPMVTNTGIFLLGLKLSGESRS